MDAKVMFNNGNSFIIIKNGKLYIATKQHEISKCAITLINGFQVELGRNIQDIQEALKYTRLPIVLKTVLEQEKVSQYQVVRMHTGKVDDKVIANILCKNGIISVVSFNRKLINDQQYRKFNQLSIVHQLSLPFNMLESGCSSRIEQVSKALSTAIMVDGTPELTEGKNNLTAVIKTNSCKIKYTFILNTSTNRYELTSMSLA